MSYVNVTYVVCVLGDRRKVFTDEAAAVRCAKGIEYSSVWMESPYNATMLVWPKDRVDGIWYSTRPPMRDRWGVPVW